MFNNKKAAPGADETTIIARGMVVRGDLQFCGSLHLEGRVEGVIDADPGAVALFTLSEQGSVNGEIRVPHAIINGSVDGDIHCSERLELAAQARVRGDVYYQVLEMAAGAQVSGRMVHESEPARQLPHALLDDETETAAHAVEA